MPFVENAGADAPQYSKLLIVGAGMSGITAAAYYKRKYGDDDFIIYERQKELGGTWWMNSYPGMSFPLLLYTREILHPCRFLGLKSLGHGNFTPYHHHHDETVIYTRHILNSGD